MLPEALKAEMVDSKAIRVLCDEPTAANRMLWGLHRALIFNKIKGLNVGFACTVNITGLGFKAVVSGDKITFSLGFSHKIVYQIPKGITVEVDKTGQNLTVKGVDKKEVGQVCSEIRALRPPEPYKGTGIKLATENIIRKAGKTKAAA
jgi:large subunit ribosomal protein L6